MKCPKCGAINTASAKFCSLCHEPFASTQSASAVKPHSTPGFGTLRSDSKSSPKKQTDQNIEKPKKVGLSNITEWLFPAIISAVLALLLSRFLPSKEITANISFPKIILLAIALGLVSSTGGLVKLNFKSFITGWLLGLSGSFLAFNILFFGSFLLVRLNPNFYTKYFLGNEVLIFSVTLSIAIGFYIWLENMPASRAFSLAALVIMGTGFMSWLIIQIMPSPFPIIAFLSWPLSYFVLLFLKQRLATEKK